MAMPIGRVGFSPPLGREGESQELAERCRRQELAKTLHYFRDGIGDDCALPGSDPLNVGHKKTSTAG